MTTFISELEMRHITNVRTLLKSKGLDEAQVNETLDQLAADQNSAWTRTIRLLETVAKEA